MGTIFGSKNFDLATQSAIFLVSKMITFGKSDSFRRIDLGSWPRVITLYCPSLLHRSLLFFTFALKNSQSSWVENYCNQCSIASFSRSAWSRTPSYCLAEHNPSFYWETGRQEQSNNSIFLFKHQFRSYMRYPASQSVLEKRFWNFTLSTTFVYIHSCIFLSWRARGQDE